MFIPSVLSWIPAVFQHGANAWWRTVFENTRVLFQSSTRASKLESSAPETSDGGQQPFSSPTVFDDVEVRWTWWAIWQQQYPIVSKPLLNCFSHMTQCWILLEDGWTGYIRKNFHLWLQYFNVLCSIDTFSVTEHMDSTSSLHCYCSPDDHRWWMFHSFYCVLGIQTISYRTPDVVVAGKTQLLEMCFRRWMLPAATTFHLCPSFIHSFHSFIITPQW